MSLQQKHALITGSSRGIGRGIALKLAEAGATIAVHYYSPAWTEDSVFNSLPESVQKLIRDLASTRLDTNARLGTPPDVGDVVSLFCSPQANWITGQVIFADGGGFADELGSATGDPTRLLGNESKSDR
jgi:NAD(P)-dependent dehydrogenase (short-subunit alcohol dehydrogenase family)